MHLLTAAHYRDQQDRQQADIIHLKVTASQKKAASSNPAISLYFVSEEAKLWIQVFVDKHNTLEPMMCYTAGLYPNPDFICAHMHSPCRTSTSVLLQSAATRPNAQTKPAASISPSNRARWRRWGWCLVRFYSCLPLTLIESRALYSHIGAHAVCVR